MNVKQDKRILILSKYDRLAASARQRFLLYKPFLKEKGIELHLSPLFDQAYLVHRYRAARPSILQTAFCYWRRLRALLNAKNWDLVVIHCDAMPYLPAGLESFLMGKGIRYVFDFDDAIFHQYDQSSKAFVRRLFGHKIATVIKSASLVFAGSEYLADYARKHNDHVMVIPTVVDTSLFPTKEHSNLDQSNPIVVGWIGSPSTTVYLNEVLGVLDQFAEQRELKLIAVGSTPVKLQYGTVENRIWSEETEISDLMECDIGIMPLLDVPWARGKCAFKLIQYMACGLPVVASPVGANKDVVKNGVGILANTDDQWISALDRLSQDSQLRTKMGLSGRRFVESNYSLKSTGPKLVQAIQTLLDSSD